MHCPRCLNLRCDTCLRFTLHFTQLKISFCVLLRVNQQSEFSSLETNNIGDKSEIVRLLKM